MSKIVLISLLGYVTGLLGFLAGNIFSFNAKKLCHHFHGALMGFTAGLLIAFVCFELLPTAFENENFYLGIIGIVLGALSSTYAENKVSVLKNLFSDVHQYIFLKTGLLIGISVMIHMIPGDIVLGSLLKSFASGVMLYISCGAIIPESKDKWYGKLSTLGAMVGFILAVLLIEF